MDNAKYHRNGADGVLLLCYICVCSENSTLLPKRNAKGAESALLRNKQADVDYFVFAGKCPFLIVLICF
jgi:hypothetical protein